MNTLITRITRLQRAVYRKLTAHRPLPRLGSGKAPKHSPEMLLIGCVDARLDPTLDIGIPRGKALIYRNIAALVAGRDSGAGDRLSVAATLEFAVNQMRVKDIVVMGHTGCGGIASFLSGHHEDTHHIYDYLQPLEQVRAEAVEKGETLEEQARDMEKAAVAFSLDNLMSYDAVRRAVEKGRLELHGWVIDTKHRLIWAMDQETGTFALMAKNTK